MTKTDKKTAGHGLTLFGAILLLVFATLAAAEGSGYMAGLTSTPIINLALLVLLVIAVVLLVGGYILDKQEKMTTRP